ncbi:MAG: GNVR domain-containing protein [Desulfobacterales bacterium]|jgi:capsular exopolysaccharide synthesis family protein
MAQYDVDLRDYWRIIKKRKTIVILMVILVGLCSYGFAKLKEPVPQYKASSAIKIESTTSLASALLGVMWNQGENMITHAYIITSFPVLGQTAKILGWLPRDITEKEIQKSDKRLSVIRRLKALITAEQEPGTNIINIQVVSRNPREAALVANTVAKAYREYHIQEKNKKTIETKNFIEKQLQATSQNLKRAEDDLQAFKEGYALISIDEQTKNLLSKLYEVESKYEKIRAARRLAASQLQAIRKVSARSSEKPFGSLYAADKDSAVFALKEKLGGLLLKRQTLRIHFTDKHPQIIEVDNKIKALISEARKELGARLRSLRTQEADILSNLHQLRKENQALPEKVLHLVRLQREVDLQSTLYSQLRTKYQETLIQESGQVEEVSIVRPAVVPPAPFNIPSPFMIVFTGLAMGMILGMVLAFGVEVFDTSMGTIEDVEESLQVPVLGIIPYLGKDDKTRKSMTEKERAKDLIAHYDPKSLAAEAFRALRTNLQFMSLEIKGKSFLITSSFVQEGKTLNVVNLALSVAQAGEKVLLIEADLRKPLIHKNFGLPKEPGLTDYVLGNYDWEEIINNISDVMLGDFEMDDILKTPGLDNLHILAAGARPPNPTEILSSHRFRDFLKAVRQKYDYIFIDAPPILPVADATEIAPLVDGVIMVYTVGRIGRGVLKRAKSTLDNVDAKVLGVILNNVKPEIGPDYFRYHSQHYYGPEKESTPAASAGIKKILQRFAELFSGSKYLQIAAIVLALALLAVGIFWTDIIK